MKFSCWLENRLLTESSKKRGSVPNHMPDPESNLIKTKEVKDRIPGGRRNTTFNPRPKTRGSEERRAIEEQ